MVKVYVLLRDGDRWQDCPTIEGARLTEEEAEAYCAEQERQRDPADDSTPRWHFLEVVMPLTTKTLGCDSANPPDADWMRGFVNATEMTP